MNSPSALLVRWETWYIATASFKELVFFIIPFWDWKVVLSIYFREIMISDPFF